MNVNPRFRDIALSCAFVSPKGGSLFNLINSYHSSQVSVLRFLRVREGDGNEVQTRKMTHEKACSKLSAKLIRMLGSDAL